MQTNEKRVAAVAVEEIERRLLALLARRAATSSICPSEVARALTDGGDGWRALMPDVRRVAFALQRGGTVVVTRGTSVVADEHDGTGPIRVRRGPAFR